MSNRLELFKACSLFEALSDSEASVLSRVSIEKKFKRGDALFNEKEKCSHIYIVQDGQVKATRYTSEGREVIIEIFGHCDMLGTVCAFSGAAYEYTAQALTNVTALLIKREDFMDILKENPGMSIKMLAVLSERYKGLQDKVSDFVSYKVEQRIAKLLLMLMDKIGTEIPFTRQEIAGMVGTTIETAIRVSSRFKQAKIIKTERGRIFIINTEKLQAIADGPPVKF